MPPQAIAAALAKADEDITAALEYVVGAAMSLAARSQAALPAAAGGFGVRQALVVAESAYLSTCGAARPLAARILGCPLSEVVAPAGAVAAVVELNDRAEGGASPTMDDCSYHERAALHEDLLTPVKEMAYIRLRHSANELDKARLLSVSGHQAGAWLTPVPLWS